MVTDTELSLRLARGEHAEKDEPDWDAKITFADGKVEWFVFKKLEVPTVAHVLKVLQREIIDPEKRVYKLVISSIKGKRNGKQDPGQGA